MTATLHPQNNRLSDMPLPDSFIKRTVSAVVFGLLAIFCCMYSRYSLLAFIVPSSLLLVWEYHSLTLGRRFIMEMVLVMFADVLLLLMLALYMENVLPASFMLLSAIPAAAVFVSILFSSTRHIRRLESDSLDHNDANASALLLFPLLYVTAPMASLLFLSSGEGGAYAPGMLLSFGAMVFGNDVFAYIFGMLFGQKKGRRKLFPSLSPKKSWAGAAGGVLMTVAIAVVCSFIVHNEWMSILHWIVLSLLVAVFGIFGDLFESLLKRYAGAKDAGHIMPGHGGLLDRFDALLLAAPVAVIYLSLFSII